MKRTILPLILLALLLTACVPEKSVTPVAATQQVLKVGDGSVEKVYTADDLKALGLAQAVFKEVAYLGVPLSVLIKDAGFDPSQVKAVKAVAVDGFSANYEPALFNKEDTLVAYARVDGPLAEDEAPFRMVLPGQEGKLNPRQLVEIQIIQ